MFGKMLLSFILFVLIELSMVRSQPKIQEVIVDTIKHPPYITEHNNKMTNVQPDPPPRNETAKMARYIVHYSDWCILAHISHHSNTSGFPAARVYSTTDGYMNISTGTPYFYVSKFDKHIDDLSRDGRSSVTFSLAEGSYCVTEKLDPEDPRCAQVILTGNFYFLDPDSEEARIGKSYLFKRHPAMKTWPESHDWYVCKFKIGNIQIIDNFGGSVYPSVADYFKASPF